MHSFLFHSFHSINKWALTLYRHFVVVVTYVSETNILHHFEKIILLIIHFIAISFLLGDKPHGGRSICLFTGVSQVPRIVLGV